MGQIDSKALPIASSAMRPELSRTALASYLDPDPISPDPLLQEPYLDMLDPNLTSLIAGLVTVTQHVYNGEAITTLAYLYHRTTTSWWIIVMYNGFIHPDEIPNGYTLNIPSIDDLLRARRSQKSNIGRDITF